MYDWQGRALVAAYIELARRHNYSDEQTRDALFDIFEESELYDLVDDDFCL